MENGVNGVNAVNSNEDISHYRTFTQVYGYKTARQIYLEFDVKQEVTLPNTDKSRQIRRSIYAIHRRYKHKKLFKSKTIKLTGEILIWRES
jgi:hypothetical protein